MLFTRINREIKKQSDFYGDSNAVQFSKCSTEPKNLDFKPVLASFYSNVVLGQAWFLWAPFRKGESQAPP